MSAAVAGTAASVALPGLAFADAKPARKAGPITVAYVEVNDHSLLSASRYPLAGDGFPVIDLALIFAANINYDGTKAYLHFNEKYADSGQNGTGQPNDHSFVRLVSALRSELPEKLITPYDIGPASDRLSYDGQSIAEVFDYAWNPYYGTWAVPGGPSDKDRLSPSAVSYTATSAGLAAALAERTVAEGTAASQKRTESLPQTSSFATI